MARLYSNENFPMQAVEELRRLGHDVLTIQEVGKAGQSLSDEDVLAFAAQEKRDPDPQSPPFYSVASAQEIPCRDSGLHL
jgi:hypothetical protein